MEFLSFFLDLKQSKTKKQKKTLLIILDLVDPSSLDLLFQERLFHRCPDELARQASN